MSIHTVSFAIQGMYCAQCAIPIGRALTRLDGVVTAQVDYATKCATVAFDSARVSAAAMVDAVRRTGFDVPLERVVLNVDDLVYTSSARTVERVLSRLDGVAQVEADLRAQRVVVDAFSGYVTLADYEREIAMLGLCVLERPAPNAAREFIARTTVAATLAALALLSAGTHANLINASAIHSPLIVIVISVLVAFGVGWRFYRLAYDAFVHGERDASVVVALLALVSLFGGMSLALMASAARFSGSALVLATLLTAGWFLARSAALWVLPRFQDAVLSSSSLV